MHILTRLRTSKGLSKNALAKAIGENSGYIVMVESYRRSLPVSVAMKIADILGADGAELHYEALLAGCMAKLKGEFQDVNPDYVEHVAQRIVRKKSKYLIEEYEEMQLLEEARNAI